MLMALLLTLFLCSGWNFLSRVLLGKNGMNCAKLTTLRTRLILKGGILIGMSQTLLSLLIRLCILRKIDPKGLFQCLRNGMTMLFINRTLGC